MFRTVCWNDFSTLYFLFSVALSLCYSYVLSKYIKGWKAVPVWKIPANFQPRTKVSVLIPARNEVENILPCLESIFGQTYPKELVEVIVLDDHSTDGTAEVVEKRKHPQVRLIRLADFVEVGETQSFKKKAIETGIGQAGGELIVTTDADCLMQVQWLELVVSFYEKKQLKFIAAPVNFYEEKNLLERFQSLDFLGMMGTTGAGIQLRWMNMCNGANLAYAKSAFLEVKGFESIDRLASGDDLLLMQKIAQKFPNQIGFLKNNSATVFTKAKPTIASFLSQRIRWASKSTTYKEWRMPFTLAMVFLFCCSIVFSFALIPFWGWAAFGLFLGQLLVKSAMDYFFLGEMARFFQREDLMRRFVPAQLLHIAYIVVVGILGNVIKRYKWKGRWVR